jgi:hypothetical protein
MTPETGDAPFLTRCDASGGGASAARQNPCGDAQNTMDCEGSFFGGPNQILAFHQRHHENDRGTGNTGHQG